MIYKIFDWIKANWFLTVLGLVGFIFFIPSAQDVMAVFFITIILEQLSLLLYKNIIVYVMNDSTLKPLFTGADGILQNNESLGFSIFQAGALISAHFIVGAAALGVYFAV